jgi:hypothetical protein
MTALLAGAVTAGIIALMYVALWSHVNDVRITHDD